MPFNDVSKSRFDPKVRKTNLDTVQDFQNHLQPTQFRLTMDRLKFPTVEFTIQSVDLPDVSVPPASLSGKQRIIPVPGDSVEFSPLEINFLIDEAMLNYEEIFLWLMGTISVEDDPEYPKTRDMTLHIMSSHNNLIREFNFYDAFPTSLSSITFDATVSDTEYALASASFDYSYFTLGKLLRSQ